MSASQGLLTPGSSLPKGPEDAPSHLKNFLNPEEEIFPEGFEGESHIVDSNRVGYRRLRANFSQQVLTYSTTLVA